MMRNIFLYLFTFFLLLPFFFLNYRLTAFHTFPFDNYYEYVLYLDGKRDAAVLESPSAYRFVYYGTAFVFYKSLPVIPLSQLNGTEKEVGVHALQALAFTSFLFLHGFFFTVFQLLHKRLGRSVMESVGMAAVAVLFSLFTFPHGVDPLYLCYVALCLYFLQNQRVLYPLLLFSPMVNEKIGLVFSVFYLGQLCFASSRSRAVFPFLISAASVGLYFLLRAVLGFSTGIYAYQTDITQFWTRVQLSVPVLMSIKGLYTNWLPLFLLMAVAAMGWHKGVFRQQSIYFHPVVMALPLFLFMLGLVTCTDYTIGRIAMHALPFYVAPMALLLDGLQESKRL